MSPRAPKVSQRAAKVSQSEPKGRPNDAKRRQKGATWEPKGAKRDPKDDQNASKNGSSEKVTKREPKRRAHGLPVKRFWNLFPSKIDVQIDTKIDAEIVMSSDEKSMQKWSGNSAEI